MVLSMQTTHKVMESSAESTSPSTTVRTALTDVTTSTPRDRDTSLLNVSDVADMWNAGTGNNVAIDDGVSLGFDNPAFSGKEASTHSGDESGVDADDDATSRRDAPAQQRDHADSQHKMADDVSEQEDQ